MTMLYDGVVTNKMPDNSEKDEFRLFMNRHHCFFLGSGVKEDFIRQIWEWTREEVSILGGDIDEVQE